MAPRGVGRKAGQARLDTERLPSPGEVSSTLPAESAESARVSLAGGGVSIGARCRAGDDGQEVRVEGHRLP